MHGIGEIDMTAQPPPDLVVEVEVSHPADKAVIAWAAIGVPEIWRFDESRGTVTFLVRRDDGSYAPADRSAGLPPLTPADVAEQLRLADSLGSSRWFQQLGPWARDVLTQRPGDA